MVKSNTLSVNLHIWPDIRPDIRNPVATGYPAGYPDPAFFSPDYPESGIRPQNLHPVQPYSVLLLWKIIVAIFKQIEAIFL